MSAQSFGMARIICFTITFLLVLTNGFSQGLEDVYIELYHVATPEEIAASEGYLNEDSKTYRVYVDLVEGFSLQAVFGNKLHPLVVGTTRTFFNDMESGKRSADLLDTERSESMLVGLDSWLSIGHADKEHIACPLFANKSGKVDGELPSLFSMLMDWTATSHRNRTGFTVEDGTWFMLEGVKGVSEENMVLIAQLTTDGQLSFKLNLQIIGPDGTVYQFVANESDDDTIVHPALDSMTNLNSYLHNH